MRHAVGLLLTFKLKKKNPNLNYNDSQIRGNSEGGKEKRTALQKGPMIKNKSFNAQVNDHSKQTARLLLLDKFQLMDFNLS